METTDVVDWEELVDAYLEACNKRDIEALLALTHPGIAYYDAFWQETCVGRDFRQYMEDWFRIDPYTYSRLGPAIVTEKGAAYRYTAVDRYQQNPHETMHTGAEVLTQRAGKIVTISDFYADPSGEALEETIQVSAMRHGQTRYAASGLGTLRKSELRRQISRLLDHELMHLDADLTVHQLADRIGCTPGQFFRVLIADFDVQIEEAMGDQTGMPVRELLRDAARRAS